MEPLGTWTVYRTASGEVRLDWWLLAAEIGFSHPLFTLVAKHLPQWREPRPDFSRGRTAQIDLRPASGGEVGGVPPTLGSQAPAPSAIA